MARTPPHSGQQVPFESWECEAEGLLEEPPKKGSCQPVYWEHTGGGDACGFPLFATLLANEELTDLTHQPKRMKREEGEEGMKEGGPRNWCHPSVSQEQQQPFRETFDIQPPPLERLGLRLEWF
ncbi:unnamed protein product [Pleuronectes platessa]|uniref:Uncharacterized protein n=1 Tax=Pleuronectes platessa TaxID=8262 RepID=A0A9N7TK78_PLEPL|nr:unnamed protein product [Pleuronectes platessa]